MTELDLLTLSAERRRNTTFVPEGAGARAVPFSMPLRPTPLSRAVSPHPFVPDDAALRRKRAELLLSIQAHGLRKRLLHTSSRVALLPVTDFCFYHLVRCGAHPRRILRLARAAFGDAAADADILRAMAALTRCLFRRPAALPDHVALGSSAQALHWPPDAAGSLWSEEIDALRRELS